MEPTVALLSSPLLGSAAWRPVARHLRSMGVSVIEDSAPTESPRTPGDVAERFLHMLPDDRPLVLVPHSNAGLYVPCLARQRDVVGYVFVDAILPPAEGGRCPIAPEGLIEALAPLADAEGMLPPWTQWWSEDDLTGLYPDDHTRAEIENEAPRVSVDYVRSSIDIPTGWARYPGTYLAFGDTYAEDRRAAQARGWEVSSLNGQHLHQLHDPARVARQILRFVDKIGSADILSR